jgi:hypothetical protein
MAANLYSVHPSIAYIQSVVSSMPTRTGRSLSEWAELVKDSEIADAKEQREWLARVHKLNTNTAWMIVEHAAGRGAEDIDPEAYLAAAPGYVEAMYSGNKAGLRPIHDALVAFARKLGKDVKVCPCKTIVPFYREHVFAEIKPATKTRIDLSLHLRGYEGDIPPRVVEKPGLRQGDRLTHRLAVTCVAEIDEELKLWLRQAYQLAG